MRNQVHGPEAVALESLPFPIAVLDGDGRVASVNPTWLRESLPAPDPTGATLEALPGPLPPSPQVARAIREVAEGRRPDFFLEYPHGERWFRLVATPLAGGSGATVVLLDVSDRVAAIRDLATQERRLRTALEFAELGLWDRDLVTGEAYYSDNMAEVMGLPPDMAFGDFLDAMHPDDRESFLENYEVSVRTGSPHHQEFRIRQPDGTWRWFEGRGRAVVEQGRPVRIVGLSMDVTSRKRAETRFKAFMEHAPMLAAVKDREGRYSYVNPAMARQVRQPPEALLGRWEEDFVEAEEVERCRASDRQVLRAGHLVEFRHTTRGPCGETKELLVLKFPIPTDSVGMIALDVTEKVRAERELHETQARVVQLERLEALGRLAGGVAHDFNNLLSGIIGFSELALGRLDPAEPLYQDLLEIRRAGRRTAELTAQLLAFSRQQVSEPRVLDLNGVVADIARMLRQLIGEDISLELRLSPGLPPIRADRGQLQQVLVNLALNARDAMPQGGRLEVRTDAVEVPAGGAEPPGRFLRLAVSDTGHGMSEAIRCRIFEPFFTTRTGRGTGLGLSTVFGIVQQSGGTVDVESAPGEGSCFTILFPVVVGVADPAEEEERPEPPRRGSETVLLVEDEDVVRKFTRRVLEMNGYRVLSAAHAQEAVKLAREHDGPIHLLLTDVVMPGMSGPQLAACLVETRPETKVLFCSGYSDEAIGRHGIPSEDALLPKPFTPRELTGKVREILERT